MASAQQETTVPIHPDELVNSVIDEDASLAVRRLFRLRKEEHMASTEHF